MAGVKNGVREVLRVQARLGYALRNLLSGWTPVHVVVSGPDDELAMALADALPRLYSPRSAVTVWGTALSTENLRAPVIVSWAPDDLSRVVQIRERFGGTRKVIFLGAVADPRNLVSEKSTTLPHHFRQGADYRLSIDGKIRSLTQPGVITRSLDLRNALDECADHTLVVTREAALRSPAEVWQGISTLVTRFGGPSPTQEGLTLSVGTGERPGDWDTSESRRQRVSDQIRRFPELDEVARSFGYPPTPPHSPAGQVGDRGVIIGFHTPDEVYRREAERLTKSLDRLGLDYEISVVEPESNWVRTTLLKPSWILPARQTHRGPLLYVDVDAFVHEDPWPYVANLEADMAAVVYPNGELNSATLWINDTDGARALLNQWATWSSDRRSLDSGALRQVGDDSDQGVLRLVVEAEEAKEFPSFQFGRLPPNLATIFDRTFEYRYGPIAIEQLQVSRESTRNEKRLARRRARTAELDS